MFNTQKKWAFTLVELIVVITILAILATIAFVSFIWYQTSARESTRLSDMKLIEKKLSFYQIENNNYPLPDNYVTITASGTTVWYQGEVGTWVLISLNQSWDIKDPLDDTRYSYTILQDRTNYQMLAFMEDDDSLRTSVISPTYANTPPRYPMTFGNKIGMLLDSENMPVQDTLWGGSIDLTQTASWYTAYLSDSETFSWSGSELRQIVPRTSCRRLHDLGEAGINWYYTINPIEWEAVEVYCDFTSDPEWWVLTMIARSVDDASFNGTPFWWFVSRWSPKNDSAPYSLGESIKNIPFQKVYLWVYDTGKNITGFTTLNVNDLSLFDGTYWNTALAVEGCVGQDITIIWIWTINSCLAFNLWGKFDSTESYWFSFNPVDTDDWLNRRRYGASFPYPWMIFIK